jgi:hypothetical protein
MFMDESSDTPPPTPRIAKLDWGRIEVDGPTDSKGGSKSVFRGAKAYPGGAREDRARRRAVSYRVLS